MFDSTELNISLANSNYRRETPRIVFGLSRFYSSFLFSRFVSHSTLPARREVRLRTYVRILLLNTLLPGIFIHLPNADSRSWHPFLPHVHPLPGINFVPVRALCGISDSIIGLQIFKLPRSQSESHTNIDYK